MSDIKKRKPRVIKLKKKAEIPKIHIDDVAIQPPPISEVTGNFNCISCGSSVNRELSRCAACNTEHQKLTARLDAKPKQVIEKVPTKWVTYKEVKNGVIVTVYMTEQEAAMLGRKIT